MQKVIIAFVVIILAVAVYWVYSTSKSKAPVTPSGTEAPTVGSGEVVVYVAHDKDYCHEVFDKFEKETGIKVNARFDTEQDKTVGHVKRIREEKNNPRCDLHWNNEPMHSVSLTREGLYTPYESKYASEIPSTFRDPKNNWTGFAARARCVIYHTGTSGAEKVKSLQDFLNPEFKGKLCIANPGAGSTQTHFAALYSVWGKAKFESWIRGVLDNETKALRSNSQTAEQVANSQFWAGLTDTDDVISRMERKMACNVTFPDADNIGTLIFPNTLALVRGGPNPENAKVLFDWLLKNEMMFCIAASAQIPLRKSLKAPAGRYSINDIKAMEVDWNKVADVRDECVALLKSLIP